MMEVVLLVPPLLLVLVFRASAISRIPALLGGAFFLLHPANVEAVAWISQLKSTAGLAFALGALLARHGRTGRWKQSVHVGRLSAPVVRQMHPAAVVKHWREIGIKPMQPDIQRPLDGIHWTVVSWPAAQGAETILLPYKPYFCHCLHLCEHEGLTSISN